MRFIKLGVGALLLALLAAACSRGDAATTTAELTTLAPVSSTEAASTTVAATSTTSTTTTTTTTTTTLGPQNPSPLNGIDIADPSSIDRRAIAVKIDNHPEARPQSGLQDADMIYELLVEGGLTRFIAVFHSTDTTYVGPIRSLRPTDSTLITYLGAPLQISGGQDWIVSLARGRGLQIISDDRVSTYRIGSRSAPHNLYGNTEKMRETADRRGWSDDPPAPIFTFGEPIRGLIPATEITLDWSDRPEVVWRWDAETEKYLRFNRDTPHDWITQDGDRSQIAVDTLLILTAREYTAYPSGSGSAVPAADTLGSGQAIVFYGGHVIQGKWERESYDDPFSISLPTDDEIIMPAGKLWISVFPSTGTLDWE